MSSPIKPPGKPPGATPPVDIAQKDGSSGVKQASEVFRDALDGAGSAKASNAPGTQGVQPNDRAARASQALHAITDDLRAGRIDASAAIDKLVARALDGASALPPTKRAELEAFLRNALADDPMLAGLVRELEPNG